MTYKGSNTQEEKALLTVGIGAADCDAQVFESFFARLPSNTGMAYVVISAIQTQEKAFDFAEALSEHSKMPVVQPSDGMEVRPDTIYLLLTDETLTLANGHFVLSRLALQPEHHRPIDTFFFSLAADQSDRAIGILLSSNSVDGALGLSAIREEGGMTFSSNEAGASPYLTESSVVNRSDEAGCSSSIDQIPEKLLDYSQHFQRMQSNCQNHNPEEELEHYLSQIISLIRDNAGHDFSNYKKKTIIRRIQRRMQILHLDNFERFITLLCQDRKELNQLFRDILIGVTEFFRDVTAFDILIEEAIPRLIKEKRSSDQIRVWVPACASGDEAYSIAIVLAEALARIPQPPQVLIFATDIDEQALNVARSGRYGEAHLNNVSPNRLERWFIKEGSHYCISPLIREMCIFSTHSVIKDPPYSKLDLISCRNLLIYFNLTLQEKLLPIFHYALRPSGLLFLGSSESIGRQTSYFNVLSEKSKLFQRRNEISPVLPYSLHFNTAGRNTGQTLDLETVPREHSFERGARRVLERYSPAHVVIDRQHRIVSFSGQTGKYLEPSPGVASLDLYHIIQKPLRPVARQILQQAISTQQRVIRENIPFEVNGSSDLVTLIIEPILQASGKAAHYIIVFQDIELRDPEPNQATAEFVGRGDLDIEQLQNELRATKARLQAALDETEEANEDLKSSNEELQSIIEELHSSNEELETSKEEMQSINEELQTVNLELSNKNDMLLRVNSDLQNFLQSTEIAILFLDEKLCVRNFTPSITELFHLRQSDIGRPIIEIASRLHYELLADDVKNTLHSMSVFEREVYLPESDATFVMHIRPYRTYTQLIQGVVITFVDISERKRHEMELSHLASIVESSEDAIMGLSLDGAITSWNSAAQHIFGHNQKGIIGQPLTLLVPPELVPNMMLALDNVLKGERMVPVELQFDSLEHHKVAISLKISAVRNMEGDIVACFLVARDITDWVRSEQQKATLLSELDHRVKNTLATVQSISRQTMRGADSLESFYKSFESRLMAVSRTHNLLVCEHWKSAHLEQIAKAELLPYGPSRFDAVGENVHLNPRQAIALGLALHELATNAAKYGAFSKPDGTVTLTWRVDPTDNILNIRWEERDGPLVQQPDKKGFGSQLIENSVLGESNGTVQLHFESTGVICHIQFKIDNNMPSSMR
jgi:two-component system CheB/CheR fusion protein